MGKPKCKLSRETVESTSLGILRTSQDTTLHDTTLSRGFGQDNLKKYCINNPIILLNVPQQPSPKELLHHEVQSGVGVHIPILTPRKTKQLRELDGRNTTKLHQVLLKPAHNHNSDYSHFLRGNEILQTIQDLTLIESNWKKVFSSSLVISSHHIE
ncbi:hypothetical protein DUI87_16926 [Hirundo rustica rustica]|uniref:Uncharacterized protein n=1 Tax=Hirundo rustica rustica TaxID=333673 RepID=A0A3M0K7Z0_HIRRU|nr:hypothetical protein DUI87_16926 [Hirundo rustica rustica]